MSKKVWLGGKPYTVTDEQFAKMHATRENPTESMREDEAIKYLQDEGVIKKPKAKKNDE